MKGTSKLILVAFVGALASRAVYADLLCAGAEGISGACAAPCSEAVVNDESGVPKNNGKFNVGGGNQGDGNTGFNNVGNFNIVPGGGKGNCLSSADQLTGLCDVNNNQGKVVLRFCQVYPSDNKCSPAGYLAEYSDALKQQIPLAVQTCQGGPAYPPIGGGPSPTTTPLPPSPATPAPTTTVAPGPTPAPGPTQAPAPGTPVTPAPTQPVVLPPGAGGVTPFTPVSDSKANLLTLFQLFEEHIAKEKALGRKLKM